ncbi:hypothetical protein Bca52824_077005 [Brassica carinata]|uniref:Uncharacterized protein n=1 Tax=Brassica carinata TaxID=52824 RepID=A0A8X7PTB1_BRACI|nr:hypothetical protein Bca52824_077005 [Brassica carinata]
MEDHTASIQSYDFSKERFQPTDDPPFSYDELNPMALEILKGGVGAMSQNKGDMHMGEALLVLTSWTNLVVVDIPEFPLIAITCNDIGMKGLCIIRVTTDLPAIKADEGN